MKAERTFVREHFTPEDNAADGVFGRVLLMTYESRFGSGAIITVGGRVKHHLWGGPLSDILAAAEERAPRAVRVKMPSDIAGALADYFQGMPVDFTGWLPDDSGFSDFAAAVYRATRGLKWGETADYSRIAAAIGRPSAVRAVGTALGRNPMPLFIPCHRVVSRHGEGGWSGPPGLKAKLLAMEARERNGRNLTA